MSAVRTASELKALSIIERAGSVLSLLGCFFVIVTFTCFRGFQKPVNRLVFYATFGNMMTNIGTLMSTSFMGKPDSAGCQMQSFLIQMFMPADAFWTFAMAVNIYLTFYHHFDTHRLSKMELPYLFCCFGVPFIPALVFIFLRDDAGQRVYSDARLWCWIGREWHVLRIAAFYAPVWVLILATILIYIRAGATIYRKRNSIQQQAPPSPTAASTSTFTTTTAAEDDAKPAEITVTTQISTTREVEDVATQLASLGLHGIYSPHEDGYQVSISSPARRAAQQDDETIVGRELSIADQKRAEMDRAAWSYTKCAALFFTALLVTWIPSSANRVHSFMYRDQSVLALEYMSALVLPLQGFWNAVIYAVTSWSACRNAWRDVTAGGRKVINKMLLRRNIRRSVIMTGDAAGGSERGYRLGSAPRTPPRSSRRADFDSESMTELAVGR